MSSDIHLSARLPTVAAIQSMLVSAMTCAYPPCGDPRVFSTRPVGRFAQAHGAPLPATPPYVPLRWTNLPRARRPPCRNGGVSLAGPQFLEVLPRGSRYDYLGRCYYLSSGVTILSGFRPNLLGLQFALPRVAYDIGRQLFFKSSARDSGRVCRLRRPEILNPVQVQKWSFAWEFCLRESCRF